jgi:hypothetical protein
MKPRTLARYALKKIKDDTFIFDSEIRKKEAIRQVKSIIKGPSKYESQRDFEDPIIELHLGLQLPHYNFPIIKTKNNGEVIIWKDDYYYNIPIFDDYIVRGITLSGKKYNLKYLRTLSLYRDCVVKTDKYTDIDRAAFILCNCMSEVDHKDKHELLNDNKMLLIDELEDIKQKYEKLCDKDETFREKSRNLYIKWLSKWIMTYGKNPETQMKILKLPEKLKDEEIFDENLEMML